MLLFLKSGNCLNCKKYKLMTFIGVSLWHLTLRCKEKCLKPILVMKCCNFTGEFEIRKDQPHTNIQYIIASAISDTNINANNNICLKLAPPWTLGGTNRYLAELAKEIRATCVPHAKGVRRCAVCCSISRSVYGAPSSADPPDGPHYMQTGCCNPESATSQSCLLASLFSLLLLLCLQLRIAYTPHGLWLPILHLTFLGRPVLP